MNDLKLWMAASEYSDTKRDAVTRVSGWATGRLDPRFVAASLLLIVGLSFAHGRALAESLKPFPEHWGAPPKIQTRDDVEWPGGYGHGSSTVAHWIQANLDKDKAGGTGASSVLYAADFDSIEPGELPDGFLVLNGKFAVREEGGSRFMELPGAPLESFAVMFGPAGHDNMEVSVRVLGTSRGRRYPAFAVGLNGLGGYRLKMAPAKRALELWRGPEDGGLAVATRPMAWTSGEWVILKLRVRKASETEWRVEGKAWLDGDDEPGEWMVSHTEADKPLPGRPFVSASPYSGTRIRFDDLMVLKVGQ